MTRTPDSKRVITSSATTHLEPSLQVAIFAHIVLIFKSSNIIFNFMISVLFPTQRTQHHYNWQHVVTSLDIYIIHTLQITWWPRNIHHTRNERRKWFTRRRSWVKNKQKIRKKVPIMSIILLILLHGSLRTLTSIILYYHSNVRHLNCVYTQTSKCEASSIWMTHNSVV
jgi:hypothetical protein